MKPRNLAGVAAPGLEQRAELFCNRSLETTRVHSPLLPRILSHHSLLWNVCLIVPNFIPGFGCLFPGEAQCTQTPFSGSPFLAVPIPLHLPLSVCPFPLQDAAAPPGETAPASALSSLSEMCSWSGGTCGSGVVADLGVVTPQRHKRPWQEDGNGFSPLNLMFYYF